MESSGIFPTGKTPLLSPNEPDKYGAGLVISLNYLWPFSLHQHHSRWKSKAEQNGESDTVG